MRGRSGGDRHDATWCLLWRAALAAALATAEWPLPHLSAAYLRGITSPNACGSAVFAARSDYSRGALPSGSGSPRLEPCKGPPALDDVLANLHETHDTLRARPVVTLQVDTSQPLCQLNIHFSHKGGVGLFKMEAYASTTCRGARKVMPRKPCLIPQPWRRV